MRNHSSRRLTADGGLALATLTAVAAMAVMAAATPGSSPQARAAPGPTATVTSSHAA
jgi:hypothetical protein